MEVQAGVEYPIAFGATMRGQAAEYCTLRYRDDFKPHSACRSGKGTFQLDGSQVPRRRQPGRHGET